MSQFRRRLPLAILCLALALALAALPAPAEVRPEFNPPNDSGWYGWRSFRFMPVIALKDVGYDSNVFLTSNPQGAYTATLVPAAQGMFQLGNRGFVTFAGYLEYVWFDKFANQSHLNYGAGVRGNLNFRRLRLFAGTQFQSHDERPGNAIDVRTHRTNALVSGGVGYEVSPATAIDLIVQEERVDYTDQDFLNVYSCISSPEFPYPGCPVYTIGDLLSRDETTGTLRITHRLTGRTQLVMDLSDHQYRFTGPMPDPALYEEVPVVGPVRNTDERRAMAGVEFMPGGPVYGTVRLGVTNFDPVVLTNQQTTQPVWQIDLFWRVKERVLLHGAFDKNFYFSIYESTVYYQQNHMALQCVVYLNRFLGLEANYERFQLLFPAVEATALFSGSEGRTDWIRSIGSGLRMRLKGRTVTTLRVARRQRTSTLPGLDDSQFLVTTGVETAF